MLSLLPHKKIRISTMSVDKKNEPNEYFRHLCGLDLTEIILHQYLHSGTRFKTKQT